MILLDATPLIALFSRSDAWHAQAKSDFRKIQKEPLFLCSPVLSEACFGLPERAQREHLWAFIERFKVAPVPLMEQELWGATFQWILKYADHQPDFADACLVVLCGMERRYRVWTYDEEFRTIWRRPDGSKIPLAFSPR